MSVVCFLLFLEPHPCLHVGRVSVSPFGLPRPTLASVHQAELLCRLVSPEWPCGAGVSWGPEAQSPWSSDPSAAGVDVANAEI